MSPNSEHEHQQQQQQQQWRQQVWVDDSSGRGSSRKQCMWCASIKCLCSAKAGICNGCWTGSRNAKPLLLLVL
jgi:hypothetical protein